MDGEAGWWTTIGKIGLLTLTRVKGVVCRPEQYRSVLELDLSRGPIERGEQGKQTEAERRENVEGQAS